MLRKGLRCVHKRIQFMQTQSNAMARADVALRAQSIVTLDTSIIGIALPAIQQALGCSSAGLQWVFNAYVIGFGGLLLLGGRLADLKGARLVFMSGFVVLGAG